MSGEPLRPKDLIPVIFTMDSEKEKVTGKQRNTSMVCSIHAAILNRILAPTSALAINCLDVASCTQYARIGSRVDGLNLYGTSPLPCVEVTTLS